MLEQEDFETADQMLVAIEPDIEKVFALIGKGDAALGAEKLIAFVKRKTACYYEEAYQELHTQFPNHHEYEQILMGAIHSGRIRLELNGQGRVLRYVGREDEAPVKT